MRIRNSFVYTLALGLLVVLATALIVGCDGPSGPIDPFGEDNVYRFGGVLVKDFNLDTATITASLERNDTLVTDAVIVHWSNTLTLSGDVYVYSVSPVETIPTGVHAISVTDSSRYDDTLVLVVPGPLSISSISPTVKAPSDLVTVTWTGAAGASGYVIAAIKQDSAYLGLGYSQWVTSQTTSIGINDSAFMDQTGGGETNPGMYDLYVYAYSGSPDSALLSNLLPTPMPSQLDDNIDEKSFSGTISGVVVTTSGSLEVIAE